VDSAKSSEKASHPELALLIQGTYEKTTIFSGFIKPWESNRLFGF